MKSMLQPAAIAALLCVCHVGNLFSQSPAPTYFDASIYNGQFVQLDWSSVDNISAYKIYRDGVLLRTITDPADTSFIDFGPVAGSTLKYCVRTVDLSATESPYQNCLIDSTFRHAVFATDSVSDAFIKVSWSLEANCLRESDSNNIYLEIWDDNNNEEFHSEVINYEDIPDDTQTSTSLHIDGGKHVLLDNAYAGSPAAGYAQRLGNTIAVDGSRMIVGAVQDNSNIGAAYIYEKIGGTWTQMAQLTPSDGKPGDQFGYAVDIHNNSAVISSRTDTGKAYVFEWSGGSWTEQDILQPNFPDAIDNFGLSVAINGDQAFVGAPNKFFDLGVIYIFRKSGTDWPQYNMIAASTLQFGQQFGTTIDVTDDYLVSGAPAESGKGAVYVMRRSGGGWIHEARLIPGSLSAGDEFGGGVAVDGTRLLAGAPGMNGDEGNVFFYKRNGSWAYSLQTAPSGIVSGNRFGEIMDISGETAIMGVPTGYADTGIAYVYEEAGGIWSLSQSLTESGLAQGDDYGMGVAANSDQLFVGAPGEDNNRGVVYIYDQAGITWTSTDKVQEGGFSPQSLEIWVKKTGNSMGYGSLFNDGSSSFNIDAPGDPRVNIKIDNIPVLYFNYVLPDNRWTHLAVVSDTASSVTKLYVNGELMDALNVFTPIGVEQLGGQDSSGTIYGMDGQVKDIRVWKTNRSAVDINNDYNERLTGSETGLAGYWKLDEGAGTSVADLTGNYPGSSITGPGTHAWITSTIPALISGEMDDFVGPDVAKSYSMTTYEIGFGYPLCSSRQDSGRTLPFQQPVLSADSSRPDSMKLSWTNPSDAISFFRFVRYSMDDKDTVQLGLTDSTATTFADVFRLGDTTSLVNGTTYKYCMVPFSTRYGLVYDEICLTSKTYDINLQATDNAYGDKVKLTWRDLSAFGDEVTLLKDGVFLAELDTDKKTYTDNNPIPGFPHEYELQLFDGTELIVSTIDTGSVNAIGKIAGRIVTEEGDYAIAGVDVQISSIIEGDTIERNTATGLNGEFSFEQVYFHEAATYDITVAPVNSSPVTGDPFTYDLDFDNPVHDTILYYGDKSYDLVPGALSLTNLTANAVSGEDAIRLSWDYTSPDSTWFKIYRDSALLTIVTDTNQHVTNEFIDYSGIPGTTYEYDVVAYSYVSPTEVTESGMSATETFAEVAPVPVLTATPMPVDGTVELTWNHTSTNIDGFRLFRENTLIASIHKDSLQQLTDYFGTPGQSTTYGIIAYRTIDTLAAVYDTISPTDIDTSYEMVSFDFVSDTTKSNTVIYPALAAPTNVTATPVPGDDRMDISWSHAKASSRNFFGFAIIRDDGSNSDTIAVVHRDFFFSQNATNRNYQFTDWHGKPDVSYTYTVAPYKSDPNYYGPTGSDTKTFPEVLAPVSFNATDDTYIGAVKMTWNHTSSNHQGFIVVKGNSPGDTLAYLGKGAREYIYTTPSKSPVSNIAFSVYAFRVVDGNRYYSNINGDDGRPAAFSNDTLTMPQNFNASDIYPNQVMLSWEYPPYVLSRFFILRDGVVIDSVANSVRFYYDTSVSKATQYIYSIQAEYLGKESAYASDKGCLSSRTTVEGSAYSINGMGIPDVRVVVEVDDLAVAEAFTDSTGFYRITGIPEVDGAKIDVTASKANAKFTEPLQTFFLDTDSLRYTVNFVDTFFHKTFMQETEVATPVPFIASIDSLTNKVELRWNATSFNFTGFRLWRELTEIADVPADQPKYYKDLVAAPGINYQYRILAYLTKPEGTTVSDTINAFVKVPPLPPVEGFNAVADADEDVIKLFWSHPTDFHSIYEIKRNGSVIASVNTGSPMVYVDSTGLPGRNYKYTITCFDFGDGGVFSSEPVTRQAQFPELAPATELTLDTIPGENKVIISWAHTSIYYDHALIYRNGEIIDTVFRSEPVKQTTDYDGRPKMIENYSVGVFKEKEDQWYASDTIQKSIKYPYLKVPQFVTPADEGPDRLDFSALYTVDGGYSGFEFYRNDSLFTKTFEQNANPEFEDTDGTPDSTYNYMVRAYKDLDVTYYSDFDTLTASFPSLEPPHNLNASDGEFFNHVLVTWDHESTANTGFILYRNGNVLDTLGSTKLDPPNNSNNGIRRYIDIINDATSQPDTLIYWIKAYKIKNSTYYFSDTSNHDAGHALVQRFQSFSSTAGQLPNEELGNSVAMAPNFGLAGTGTSQNRARTFVPDASNNFSLDTTYAPEASSGSSPAFGWDVAASGNRVAISAPWAWDTDPNSYTYRAGEIYVYDRSEGKLALDTNLQNFQFEPAVHADNNNINDTHSPTIVESNDYAPGYTVTATAGTVGQPDTATSGSAAPFSTFTAGLEFSVYKNTRIDNVTVYPAVAPTFGTVNIAVRISEVGGSVVHITNYTHAEWFQNYLPTPINVNAVLPPGDYVMDAVGSNVDDMLRNSGGGLSYPYTEPTNSIEITTATNNTNFYYFFYDWNITAFDTTGQRMHETVDNYYSNHTTSNFNVNLPNSVNTLNSTIRLEEVEIEMSKSGSQRVLIENMTLIKNSDGRDVELFSTNTSASCPQNDIDASFLREGGSMHLSANCTDPVTGSFIPVDDFDVNFNDLGGSTDGNYRLEYTVRLIDPDSGPGSSLDTLDATVTVDSVNLKFVTMPGGQFEKYLTRNARMGYSVDMTSNTVIGGAPYYLDGNKKGLVTTFNVDTTGGWARQDTIFPAINDDVLQGFDVALEENRLLVGFPRYYVNSSAWARGQVRYYALNNDGKWDEEQILNPTKKGNGDDQFGYSIAMDDGMVAIGEPGYDNGTFYDAGVVELLTYDPVDDKFVSMGTITNPDDPKKKYERFGHSVAIKGNLMAVGAPGTEGSGGNVIGAVYVYEQDEEDNWVYKQRYRAPDEQNNARFGHSVAISGNTVMVGAPGHNSKTGKVYFIYVREQIDSVIASDGTEGNKTRISWVYNGIRENLSNFHVYRDDVLIAAADPNKSFVFDYDGIPGKKYVYSVRTVSLDNVEGSPKADKGWRGKNGILDGTVVTDIGSVGVPGVDITAWTHVDGERFEYKAVTDNEGDYKIKRIYYGDSTRVYVSAKLAGHEFNIDTQSMEYNIQQYELVADPFRDLTAYAAIGKVKHQGVDCGIDSVTVFRDEIRTDGNISREQVLTNEEGEFSFLIYPYRDDVESYKFEIDTIRATAGTNIDSVFFTFDKSTATLSRSYLDSAPFVTDLGNFVEETQYETTIFVRDVCGPIGENRWIVLIESNDGCYKNTITTNINGRHTLDLPPYNYNVRVIGVHNPSPDNIPVVDYLKVRPRSLKIKDYHDGLNAPMSDTTFDQEFIYHVVPRIELAGLSGFHCDDPNGPVVVQQGDIKTYTLEVSELTPSGRCHVNEGFLIIRNSAAREPNARIDLDPATGQFPPYTFQVGEPSLIGPFYIKDMIIEYHTEIDGFIGDKIQPFIVEGIASIPGNDIFVEPKENNNQIQLPLMILRDPPGDGSYSYIDSGQSFEAKLSVSEKHNFVGGLSVEASFQPPGVTIGIEQENGGGFGNNKEYTVTMETNKKISTSPVSEVDNAANDDWLTGKSADVIVGAGSALQYGIAREISVDPNCNIINRKVITTGVKIKTMWIYTVDQITHLISQYKKNVEQAENGTYILDGKTKQETIDYHETLITNWENVLEYYAEKTLPHYTLCDPNNYSDIPEPWKSNLDDWRENGFCTKIGSYENVNGKKEFVLNADSTWSWDTDLLNRFNKVKSVVRDIQDNYMNYTGAGQTYSESALDNVKVDEAYNALYGPDAKNITFSGGTSYSEERKVSRGESTSHDQFWHNDTKIFAGIKFEGDITQTVGTWAGLGGGVVIQFDVVLFQWSVEVKGFFQYQFNYEETETTTTGSYQTVGYELTDDDPGDQYSVTIVRGVQPTHTPYFALTGGRTSCPNEPGAIDRDIPRIDLRYPDGTGVNNTAHNVEPEDVAKFPIQMFNGNEFEEGRWYELYVVENTNPYGATVTVNGKVLSTNGAEEYFIPAQESHFVMLGIKKGPFSYDYEGIKIGMRPKCDPYIVDDVELNVHFRHPCSNVSIVEPGEDWLVNSDTTNLQINMADYDVYNDQLKRLQLVTRRVGDLQWDTLLSITKDSLQSYFEIHRLTYPTPLYPWVWDVTSPKQYVDGRYELMVIANCGTNGVVLSNRVQGNIDRNGFQVFGKPKPADGLLSLGDEISVAFNKQIDCPRTMGTITYAFHADSANGDTVSVSMACFGNKILFEIDSLEQYEGRMIYAHLDSVQDKSGNLQQAPVDWSFEVSNNPVFWAPRNIEVTVEKGKTGSVSAWLKNTGTGNEGYLLLNNQPWIVPHNAVGVILPSGEKITFDIDARALEVGTYFDTVVADISGYTEELLTMTVHVIKPTPDWKVEEGDYEYNVSVIALPSIDSVNSTDTNDVVLAYISGELRGKGKVRSVGAGYNAAYLTVMGNDNDKNKDIDFRVWDASKGALYQGHPENPNIEFKTNNVIYGTTPNPEIIRVDSDIDSIRYIPLNKGWTWFSLNTTEDDMSVNNALRSLTPTTGDVIMTRTRSSEYLNGTWTPVGPPNSRLQSLDSTSGYLIHLAEADTLLVSGRAVMNSLIFLENGWNLIGYQPQKAQAIDEAWQSPNPDWDDGDVIKSQTEFSVYNDADDVWEGNLQTMRPNAGYMVKSGSAKPAFYRGSGPATWNVTEGAFEHVMRMVVVLQVDGYEFMDNSSMVAAYHGSQNRGVGKLEYIPAINRYVAELMVYSNGNDEQPIKFYIWDALTDTVYTCAQEVQFAEGKLTGRLRTPFVLSPNETSTGISNLGSDGLTPDFQISPNPFKDELQINFRDYQSQKYEVELFNGVGELFYQRGVTSAAGENTWKLKPGVKLASGMYYVVIKSGGSVVQTFKLVKE